MTRRSLLAAVAALPVLAGLPGCKVGPDYVPPTAPVPATFKELDGWTPAQPADGIDRGAWWSIFGNPLLDRLVRDIDAGNQNLRAYEAAYRQAVALVKEARSGLFPTVTAGPSISRQRSGGTTYTSSSAEASASWDIDVWGKVRRQVESQGAAAQASTAQLASIRLSAQAELATDYVTLRYYDSLIGLLNSTAAAYERSQKLTENQYAAGVAARSDVINAQTQLQSVRAQVEAARVNRATYEHAIALLTGRSPAELSIPPGTLSSRVPVVPTTLPSTLLQRRPDIAEAERTVQQQNALIGVSVAAYYPTISLSAVVGFAGGGLSSLVSASNQVWSLAASGTQTLIDGGYRRAAVEAARAAQEQSVAEYRQTVLTAFQDVEDRLSALHYLQSQAAAQQETVTLARRAVELALNEYRAGTQNYTTVVTAQVTALSAEQTLLQVQQSRLTAAIGLVKALGGGWSSDQLPAVPGTSAH